ncbi:GHKL domain-containing protein [bacterium]|nr:GHKL domain-containing protein [bacterium]
MLRQNKLDQAQELADKAMAFYVKGGYTKSRLETLELQAQIAEAKKEYERAYELLSEAYALKDSVFSTERDRDVNFMELQLQQQENEYLTKEREANLDHIGHQNEIIAAKNKQNIFLVIAIVLTSALLLLTLYSRRKDVQTNHQLREQNDKIEEQYHALLDSERSKDNIMSMVAHDLSSPLRSILGLTQMQLDQENLPDETKHILKMIGSSAEKGIRLTGSLLESVKFNSAESGVAEKFNLYSALHDTIEINSRLAKSKQISLENNTDKSIYLSLPKDNFGRVTDNLISNAIKFSEPNKTIRINSKKMGHKVMIEIADEGQGFSEKDLQRAFMPFQQLSAKPTSGEKSTGLGLFIVKSLVTQMGGQISLVSKKGQGATFTLTFFEG